MPQDTDDGGAERQPDVREQRLSGYREAAKWAVVGHALPGEELTSPYLEDAQMWLCVYRELLAFKERLISDTNSALAALSTPGRDEVQQTDALILAAEADRFRHRILLWERRCRELGPKED